MMQIKAPFDPVSLDKPPANTCTLNIIDVRIFTVRKDSNAYPSPQVLGSCTCSAAREGLSSRVLAPRRILPSGTRVPRRYGDTDATRRACCTMEDSTTGVDELKLDVTMEVCGSTCAAATADTVPVDRLPSHTGGAEADTNLSRYAETRSRPERERGQAANKTLATIAVAQPVSVLATPIRSNSKILDSRACVRIDLGGLHCSGKNVTDSSEENPAASSQNPTPSTTVAPMRVFQPDEGRTHPVPNVTLTTNNRRLVPVASRDRAKMSFVKPNCSYNCLIGMALLAHERLPVGGIYSYIR